MNKTIYIAGKVSGEPLEDCVMKFDKAQKEIEDLGFKAVNPVKMVQEYLFADAELRHSSEEVIWIFAMKKCLEALEFCDAIYMLPCYTDSKGAMIEHRTATKLGIQIYYELETII